MPVLRSLTLTRHKFSDALSNSVNCAGDNDDLISFNATKTPLYSASFLVFLIPDGPARSCCIVSTFNVLTLIFPVAVSLVILRSVLN